jgi:hypothetical protein
MPEGKVTTEFVVPSRTLNVFVAPFPVVDTTEYPDPDIVAL